MRKGTIALLLTGVMMLSGVSTVFAEDNSDRIAEIEAQIEELQAELRKLKSQESRITAPKESDGIEEVGIYDFPDNSVLVRLKNTSGKDNAISLRIYVYNVEGKLVRDFDETFFNIKDNSDVAFVFYKNDSSDTYEIKYGVKQFDYDLSKEDKELFFDSYEEFIQWEETYSDEYGITICYTNMSEKDIYCSPYIIWYKDGEVIGADSGNGIGCIGASDKITEEYLYPLYNDDEWIIPDNYEIVMGACGS